MIIEDFLDYKMKLKLKNSYLICLKIFKFEFLMVETL